MIIIKNSTVISFDFDNNKEKVYCKFRTLYTAYKDETFILNEIGTSNRDAQL